MATNDVWRLSCLGSHSGTEIAVMTMHIRMKTNVGTFDGASAYVKTNLLTLLKGHQGSTFRWDKIVGLKITPLPKESAEYTTGFPLAGTASGEEMPHQVACIASQKTAYAGRSYRGRHYIPGTDESQWQFGILSVPSTSAIQTYYDDLVAALGLGGSNADYEWVVWSSQLNTSTPVKQVIVRNIPGVIRRRRVGVGQ